MECIFPIDRDVVMRDCVEQAHRPMLLRTAIRVDRHLDAFGEQIKAEV